VVVAVATVDRPAILGGDKAVTLDGLEANRWPIGSGVTESAVKQFNPPKADVKGTEQFWSVPGVESILSLRALWLSQDGRWERYWNTRPAYSKAA